MNDDFKVTSGQLATPQHRRRWSPTVAQLTLVLVLVGVIWRTVRYALGFPIWGDEAFVAVDFVVRNFGEMIQPSVYGQIQPIPFMWAELAITRALGLSEWALHLLPYVSGIVALLLFWRFAPQVLPKRAALLAIGIFAASMYIVRHATEVKPYSTDLLISLALTMLAWRLFRRPYSINRWIVLVVFTGVAVWCSYPAVFVGGSVGLLLTWMLLRGNFQPRILLGWLAFGVVFCGSFMVMYFFVARPHAEFAARLTEIDMWTLAFPPLAEPWKLPLWLVAIHTGEMFAYPHGGKPPGSVVTFILVVIGSVRLWRTNRPLLLLLLGPLPLTFCAAALHTYPYGGSARTSLYMAPAFCLLAGLGWSTILRVFLGGDRLRLALLVSVGALAAFALGGAVYDVVKPYHAVAEYRSRAAVQGIARQTAPGDRWVIFNAQDEAPYAPNLREWKGVGGQFVFDVLRFAPGPPDWAPPPDKIERPPGQRVWLLAYRAIHKKVVFSDEQLADYVAKAADHLGEPVHKTFSVKRDIDKQGSLKEESVEVYEFGP